ncbi:PspC [Desulforapulum autotrophicum HRM2]|uniref:PspC n=1 Tax=Desulforapulum autotrophicum (strain ATCC 43914 / DSM 3382 / VKM B-1955 / HRM2) TaxID=177437 RepID=C0QD41_DESAH|nr:PspC domain-containing protein [Desulforapulum autotrophicum]ACN17273.1 PspC [Desulforapulum autotrophicum HRM2]
MGKGRFNHQGRGRAGTRSRHPRWNSNFTSLRQDLFRSRSGVLMGVCRGIANRFDLSVHLVRAVAVFLLFVSGFWPVVGLYFLAAFLLKPEPVAPIHSEAEGDFYENYVTSRKAAIRSIHSRFTTLERKILRLEDAVTSREFDWDEKF